VSAQKYAYKNGNMGLYFRVGLFGQFAPQGFQLHYYYGWFLPSIFFIDYTIDIFVYFQVKLWYHSITTAK
jgi:hypothetical protein